MELNNNLNSIENEVKEEDLENEDWIESYIDAVDKLSLTKDFKDIGLGTVVDYAILLNIKSKNNSSTIWIKRLTPKETLSSLGERVDKQKIELSQKGIRAIESLIFVVNPYSEILKKLAFNKKYINCILEEDSEFPEIGDEVKIKASKIWDNFYARPKALFRIKK